MTDRPEDTPSRSSGSEESELCPCVEHRPNIAQPPEYRSAEAIRRALGKRAYLL